MTDHRLAWFAIGAACSVVVFGWLWHSRFSRFGRIIPRGTRSISYPDPGPDRHPTNPFTGKPVKPQLPSPQIISGDTHD